MSAETAELVDVRSVGTTRHRVRGVGFHEHRHLVTGDGRRVEVTSRPGKPWRMAQVLTYAEDGTVSREVTRSPGGLPWLLSVAGYRLIDG